MLPAYKRKTQEAIKRLNGLSKKLETMVDHDEYCPDMLEIALSMKGHIKHMQGLILESHLQTCAPKNLTNSPKVRQKFVKELADVIGLSTR